MLQNLLLHGVLLKKPTDTYFVIAHQDEHLLHTYTWFPGGYHHRYIYIGGFEGGKEGQCPAKCDFRPQNKPTKCQINLSASKSIS